MEEFQFEGVDVVSQARSQIRVKTVNQILFQEIDGLLLRFTVFRGRLGDHRVDFGPHLRLSVDVNQRVKYLITHDDLLMLNLVVELLSHLNTRLFHILTIEMLKGATKLFTSLLSDWKLLRVEDFSVS